MGDLENKKDELAGKAKEAVGEATGNEDVANEGKADQVASEAKDKLSDVADTIKDKANDIIGGLKKD
ncbi:CsbD family protein [Corynebacterium macginleyi]|uniref:CsbD family protein n=1 Tax=Corynebacterium macginleyi TaxID=38290 RepID=A0A3M0H3T5_9CORY|nr:CsbD family protein [Corynebacterium macginleyi]MBK4137441.1 CsbD family protein [Corynebacterium macginleyi]MBK4139906.1 CsbD family protein [Corynebacterium macginleyi]MBK4142068.1 CsbD family protein [Corynebacterium macginleyi]MBK4143716.1 CsbD family protein [Corynebacterium macginleyi]MBK4145515.1 CsbD family protein [Corynebacterium macginleyi]